MSTNQPIHVLLVEYDHISARVGRTMLQRLGCRVTTAKNGVEAIQCLKQGTFDLILMDWQMPLMDGFETTATIRASPQIPHIPIVGTSANMLRTDCLAVGMDDWMPKPFLFEKLRKILTTWTGWQPPGTEAEE